MVKFNVLTDYGLPKIIYTIDWRKEGKPAPGEMDQSDLELGQLARSPITQPNFHSKTLQLTFVLELEERGLSFDATKS